jgi:MFS family permease
MSLNRLRWLILGLLCASTVINYIDRLALGVLLPQLRQELGITSAQYGEITTAFMVAYTLAQVAGGMVIDPPGHPDRLHPLRGRMVPGRRRPCPGLERRIAPCSCDFCLG